MKYILAYIAIWIFAQVVAYLYAGKVAAGFTAAIVGLLILLFGPLFYWLQGW